MIGKALQSPAAFTFRLHSLAQGDLVNIKPYGLMYALQTRPVVENPRLHDLQTSAFWVGVLLQTSIDDEGVVLSGQTLEYLLGTTSASNSGIMVGDDIFPVGTDAATLSTPVIGAEFTDPEQAIISLFAAANLPSEYPVRLGSQHWVAGTTLSTEVPRWYTLIQGLDAICAYSEPAGSWYIDNAGNVIVGTGRNLYRTPPRQVIVTSSFQEILSAVNNVGYRAENMIVTTDASRLVGRVFIVADELVAGVQTTDDFVVQGARQRTAIVTAGGSVTTQEAERLAERIAQARGRILVSIQLQYEGRSKIINHARPGDVVGIFDPRVAWPTLPPEGAWVTRLGNFSFTPYPAVVTYMNMPLIQGMSVFWTSFDGGTVIDLTDNMIWEDGQPLMVQAGDSISAYYETLLNSGSFVSQPTVVPDGADWEWR